MLSVPLFIIIIITYIFQSKTKIVNNDDDKTNINNIGSLNSPPSSSSTLPRKSNAITPLVDSDKSESRNHTSIAINNGNDDNTPKAISDLSANVRKAPPPSSSPSKGDINTTVAGGSANNPKKAPPPSSNPSNADNKTISDSNTNTNTSGSTSGSTRKPPPPKKKKQRDG